jgi:hypothetical protein
MNIRKLKTIFLKIFKRLTGRAPKPYSGTEEIFAWMNFAVTGMFTVEDAYVMDAAVARLPSAKPILEIGSFAGRSTCFLLHFLKNHQAANPLICADNWKFENSHAAGFIEGSRLTHAQYREYIMKLFTLNVSTFHADRLPKSVVASSNEFFQWWEEKRGVETLQGEKVQLGGQFSFVFIDGNHTYDQTKFDFTLSDRFLEPGGLCFMHDTGNDDFGCRQVLKEVLKEGRYELLMENPNALLRKKA